VAPPAGCCLVGGVGVFFLCLLSLSGRVMRFGWGLVGGVFDLWIVDASIWQQPKNVWVVVFCFCSGPAASLIGGWWGVSFVVFVECL
jgi:hypothetical protein